MTLILWIVSLSLLLILIVREFSRRSEQTSDLQTALDRIRKDLESKNEALSQEREEIAALMGAISDAILAVNADSRTLFYNANFKAIFAQPGLDLAKAALTDLIRDPLVVQGFQMVLKEGLPMVLQTQLETRDTIQAQSFELSIAPLKKAQTVYGAIGVFHNVSSLKLAEKMRIDFVANVSHELRTPLTSIKGYTDTALSDLREQRMEGVPKFLEIISRNADRLRALVEDLLDLSALDAGVELSKAWLGTKDVTERVLLQVESKRAEKNHTIKVQYEETQVFADEQRLEQVLLNLVDNAIKYTPKGGEIKVRWAHSGSGVLFQVSDNGPGIPKESQTRIFERFYRVDKARSREMGGTGLGLAIVKHILQRHGGQISVKSELGQGTAFTCLFPN